MKRFTAFLTALLVFAGCFIFGAEPASAASSLPNIQAEAYILIDMTTGEVLTEKNSTETHYPASTTKMMTAILAIENLDLNATWTADAEVYATGGSRLTLINGEECKIKDVLYATMVKSANDGSVFLAKATAGTTEKFLDMMNRKAADLGCVNTHFANPNGLHLENHYSCAADLAKIALYCMKNPTFRDIVKTPSYTMPATNLSSERTVQNTNLLLYDCTESNKVSVNGQLRYCKYDGILGIKTGYTPEAQGCLVSAAERDGTSILCVVLKSSTMGRFSDSIALLDWGFANFRTQQVMEKGRDMGIGNVKKGSVKTVGLTSVDDVIMTLPASASSNLIQIESDIPDPIPAPITKGQQVGTYTIYEGGLEVGTYPILATEDVPEGGILSIFGIEDAVAHKIFLITGISLGSIIFLGFAFVMIMHYRAVQRRKKKAAAKAARLAAKKAAEEAQRREWMERFDSRYQITNEEDERR